MKKYPSLLMVLGLVAILAVPSLALAINLQTGEQVLLQESAIQDDVYAFGGNINSTSNIFGDLIAGGGNVLIDGSVSQDLFVGGGSVTIIADVGDDLRVGGGNVSIVGSVGGDLIAGGGQVQVSGDGIAGDVLWGGGSLQLNAPVRGDLTVGGGEVLINSTVSGDVVFKGQKLVLGSNAQINGSLSYTSSEEAEIHEEATVLGEISYRPLTASTHKGSGIDKGVLAAIFSAAYLAKFLMWLVAALIFGLLLKRFSNTMVSHGLSRPFFELGRGFLALVAIPVASIILMVTVIGLPLGILGLIGYVAIIIFSSIAAPILMGSLLHKWIKKPEGYLVSWKTIVLGVAVYFLLGLVPVIGWIIRCAFVLISLGALTKIKIDVVKEWR